MENGNGNPHIPMKEKGNPFTFYFPYQWLKTEIPWRRVSELDFTEPCRLEVSGHQALSLIAVIATL